MSLWTWEEQFLPEDLGRSNGVWILRDGLPVADVTTQYAKRDAAYIVYALTHAESQPPPVAVRDGFVQRLEAADDLRRQVVASSAENATLRRQLDSALEAFRAARANAQKLSDLFPHDDLGEYDAADFKDRAAGTLRCAEKAREFLSAMSSPGLPTGTARLAG
jgi:hypothetical protein